MQPPLSMKKVIDLGFWETPCIVILSGLGLVMNIQKIKKSLIMRW
jgi:uncharacterized membrane protein